VSLTRRIRATAVLGALTMVGALAVPLPAAAAPGDDVLVFSNPSVVDTGVGVDGGEFEWLSAALTAAGYDVTPFDGGDGSALAWTTALTDIEVFVLPEQENGTFYDPSNPPSWLSTDAHDALVAWIQGGGSMVQSYACSGSEISVLNAATGQDYSSSLDCNGTTATRYLNDAALPATLDTPSATAGFTLTGMSDEQRDAITVWYAGVVIECGPTGDDVMTAGVFAAGSGTVSYLGWDYFNDTSGDQASWNAVLASMVDGNAAASTWMPSAVPSPTPKPTVGGTTAAGETLYTISPFTSCDSEHVLMRLDPASALATPVGSAEIDGDAKQGAWSAADGVGYFPFFDFDIGEDVLMAVDPSTGAFTFEGEIAGPDVDYFDEVYSLAIGLDGQAYLMARAEVDGTYYDVALFSIDVTDASVAFIAPIDDDLLDEPNGFAVDPQTGFFYAFEEDDLTLFQVNVDTGALTEFGVLDSASITGSTDVTALQIGVDGTFWVVFDEVAGELDDSVGMLATFRLADISGGDIPTTEVGVITDDPVPSWSLLLVSSLELAATGSVADASLLLVALGIALMLLLAGTIVLRRRAA